MSEIEMCVAEGLMDGEICDLYLDVSRILDALQTLEATGGWQRPVEPALHTIRRLCEVLLQRVVTVQTENLGKEEVWER